MVRIALAVRPCLPITRPRSSFATLSSSTEAVSPWVSLTSTASGWLTSCLAKNATSSFMDVAAPCVRHAGTSEVLAPARRMSWATVCVGRAPFLSHAAALLARHRVDDRLDALELVFRAREVGALEELLHPGDHADQVSDRAHLLDGAELVAEVFEVELVPPELLGDVLGGRPVVGLLGALDERQHVAHAEDARGDALRVERLEGLELLPRADEHDRLARHGAQRERRATAGVALDLREDDPADGQPPREPLGGGHSVLTGHRVGDEEHLAGADGGDEPLELPHELLVDRLAAGGVEQHGVGARGARRRDRPAGARGRVVVPRGMDRYAELPGERLELRHGRRPVDVDRRQVRGASALLAKVPRELGGGGRLARAVETDEHHHDGRRPAEVERRGRAAERPHQLAVDQLDEVLFRREAAEHLLAEGVAFDRLDKVADDVEVDVGLEEREPHVAQRFFDVALGDPPLALQLAEERVELLAEGLEHQERTAVREELTVTGG